MAEMDRIARWILSVVVLTCSLVLVASASPVPQTPAPSPIVAELLKDWSAQQSVLRQLANAMPEDKYSYRATPNERTFGEQVMHVASVNMDLLKTLGGKATAPSCSEATAKSKADMVKCLADTYDYGMALLKEQTDASIAERVKAPTFIGTGAGATFLGPSSRARIFWFLMGHSMDIYGQMVVYARVNGVVPPASGGQFQ